MTMKTVFAALGVVLCGFMAKADAPATATWKEGGNRAVLADPGNWTCYDAGGEVMEGASPSADTTVVTVTGETSFTCPAGTTPIWKSLTVNGSVTLTADCDWRGLGSANAVIAENTTIDLKGYNLHLPSEVLEGSSQLAFTDTSDACDILTYIQSTNGGHQWIDTELTPSSDDCIETRVNFDNVNDFGAIWCTRKNPGGTFTAFVTASKFRFDHFPTLKSASASGSVQTGTDYSIVANGKTGKVTIDDGKSKSEMGMNVDKTQQPYDLPAPLTLFMAFLGDHATSQGSWGLFKCYSFKVYDTADDTLKLDLVPARRLHDGAVGMLDRKTNKFHPNKGTTGTDFTAGAIITNGVAGELHVEVPAGVMATGGQNTFQGALKLVKDGAGTLVPAGTLTHRGGTRIDGGTFQMPASDVTIGVGETGVAITVGPQGTLDMDGKYPFWDNVINLAGGTLQNTGGDIGNNKAQLRFVRLTADSAMRRASPSGAAW